MLRVNLANFSMTATTKGIVRALVSSCIAVSSVASADVADLRSSAREIRFGLIDHGHALSLPERKLVRRNLAESFITLQKNARRRGAPIPSPGRSLVSLSVALQRLIEATPNQQLSPAAQAQLQRQMARASSILQSKIE